MMYNNDFNSHLAFLLFGFSYLLFQCLLSTHYIFRTNKLYYNCRSILQKMYTQGIKRECNRAFINCKMGIYDDCLHVFSCSGNEQAQHTPCPNLDHSFLFPGYKKWLMHCSSAKPFGEGRGEITQRSLLHKNNKGDLCCEAVASISDKLPQWGVNAASRIHGSLSVSFWTAEMSPSLRMLSAANWTCHNQTITPVHLSPRAGCGNDTWFSARPTTKRRSKLLVLITKYKCLLFFSPCKYKCWKSA